MIIAENYTFMSWIVMTCRFCSADIVRMLTEPLINSVMFYGYTGVSCLLAKCRNTHTL